jgi:nucleoside-diphosphate-sugar epimerase
MTPNASKRSVLILGANGRLGVAAVRAFREAGWAVTAQARSAPRAPLPAGTTALACDALDADRLAMAARDSSVIVNALNPNYARWDTLLPPLTRAVMQVAEASGALLMLPGNVYNFGRELPADLTEDTPFVADTPKAAQRIELERAMADGAARGVNSVVIRAGDFLGEGETWLGLAFARSLAKGVVTHPGPDDIPHAWAYLPDLAQAFVKVAERREALRGFTVLHYEGITLTGRQLHAAIEAAVGHPLKAKRMSWGFLKLIGVFSPELRAVIAMRYLWERPHRLREDRLVALVGPLPHTPIDVAVADSLGMKRPQR